MKKLLSVALLFLAATQLQAQSLTYLQQKSVMNKIDSLVYNYINYSSMKMPGKMSVSDLSIYKYTSLFTADAMVFDEVCPAFYDDDKTNPYQLKERSIADYAKHIKQYFPEGMNVKLLNSNITYTDLTNKKVSVVLEKIVKGSASNGINVENHDTVLLELKVEADYSKVRIQHIGMLGSSFHLTNDKDGDFVKDDEDKCPTLRGLINPTGCPTKEEKAIADALAKGVTQKDLEEKKRNEDLAIALKEKKQREEAELAAIAKADKDKKAADAAEAIRLKKEADAVAVADAAKKKAESDAIAAADAAKKKAEADAIALQNKNKTDAQIAEAARLKKEADAIAAADAAKKKAADDAIALENKNKTNAQIAEAAKKRAEQDAIAAAENAKKKAADDAIAQVEAAKRQAERDEQARIAQAEQAKIAAEEKANQERLLAQQAEEKRLKEEARRNRPYLPRVYFTANVLAGSFKMDGSNVSLTNGYSRHIAKLDTSSDIGFAKKSTVGFDAQLEYYFGKKARFGVGAGLNFLSQKADMELAKNFHVEYKSVDGNGTTFRQIISAKPITENIKITNVNLPITLNYKAPLTEKLDLTVTAGLLFNLQIKNTYTTNAAFNYEAVYAYDATAQSVYDSSVTPSSSSWVITAAQFNKHKGTSTQSASDYMDALNKDADFNVGLNKTPTKATGGTALKSAGVGLIINPSVSYKVNEQIAVSLGGYFISQSFTNNDFNKNYQITNDVNSYHTLQNSFDKFKYSSVGVSIGVRILLKKLQ